MTPRRLLLTAALPALLALPQTAAAQAAGPDDGVTVARGAHGYVLKFGKRAAKTYRRIAGRRIKVSCETVSRIPNGSGYRVDGGSSGVVKRRGSAGASPPSTAAVPTSARSGSRRPATSWSPPRPSPLGG